MGIQCKSLGFLTPRSLDDACAPCLGVLKTLFCAAFINEMSSLHEENIEFSVGGRVSPKSAASRRRVDFSSEVTTLYEYTVRPVRVSHP